MATRNETQRRKAKLRDMLAGAGRHGRLAPGAKLPSVRDLARQFELSVDVTRVVVGSLVEEGLLVTVPGSGTYVRRTAGERQGIYLLASAFSEAELRADAGDSHFPSIRDGFEDRISQLGGTSMVLFRDTFERDLAPEFAAQIAGVFEFRALAAFQPLFASWKLPKVLFDNYDTGTDVVDFDNADGGYQAARHLLELGHREIAFLGVHGRRHHPDIDFWSRWSREREEGWRRAMVDAGLQTEGMVFQPQEAPAPGHDFQVQAARRAAAAMVQRSSLRAVVTANSCCAAGLFLALRDAAIPTHDWPAIVSFDSEIETHAKLAGAAGSVTALRLPWDRLGAAAADLLWQRSHGKLPEAPQHRQVVMKLIKRLTCRPSWSQASYPAVKAILETMH